MDIKDYRGFIEIMYPCRTSDVYEDMELEFKAFSKNKIHRAKVEEHLIHLVATDIDPNIDFFFHCLSKFDTTKKGTLSYEDFDEAISQILPTSPNKQRKIISKQAQLHYNRNEIPIERLARVAAYIMIRLWYFYSQSSYDHNWKPQSLISPDFVPSRRKSNDFTQEIPSIVTDS